MPKHIFDQPVITLNTYDISTWVDSAEFLIGKRPTVDVTGLGDTYDQNLSPNLRRWSVRLNYFQGYDATSSGGNIGGIYNVLKSVYDSTANSGVAFVLRPSSSTRSATNPDWSGNVGIDSDFSIAAGAVAEANRGSITLKGLGTLSFITSATA